MQTSVVTGWVSLRAFARVLDIQPAAVSHAARSGRLRESVRRDEHGRVNAINVAVGLREWKENGNYTRSPQRVADMLVSVQMDDEPTTEGDRQAIAEGRAEIQAGRVYSTAQVKEALDDSHAIVNPRAIDKLAPVESLTMDNAATRQKHYDAKLKQLKYEEAAGLLVEAQHVEQRLADVFTECKTKILGVPDALRQQDPTITAVQLALVKKLLNQACTVLTLGSGDA